MSVDWGQEQQSVLLGVLGRVGVGRSWGRWGAVAVDVGRGCAGRWVGLKEEADFRKLAFCK